MFRHVSWKLAPIGSLSPLCLSLRLSSLQTADEAQRESSTRGGR